MSHSTCSALYSVYCLLTYQHVPQFTITIDKKKTFWLVKTNLFFNVYKSNWVIMIDPLYVLKVSYIINLV